jgi:hypothetical protein
MTVSCNKNQSHLIWCCYSKKLKTGLALCLYEKYVPYEELE